MGFEEKTELIQCFMMYSLIFQFKMYKSLGCGLCNDKLRKISGKTEDSPFRISKVGYSKVG